MTWSLASVSCKITGFSWDNDHQISFPSKNFLLVSDNCEIFTVINCCLSLYTKTHHWPDILHITGWWETPATCSYTQQDSSWVDHASWLSLIPFWLDCNYTFLRPLHFLLLSSAISISTPPNHGYTHASARWEQIRLEPNNGHCI